MINSYNTTLKNKRGVLTKIEVSDFPATQGLDLQTRLLTFITPLCAGIDLKNGFSMSKILNAGIDMEKIVDGLLKSLNSQLVISLILDLLSFTRVNGREVSKREIFDIEFAGEYNLLFSTLSFVIKSNFGGGAGESFFDLDTIGKALAEKKLKDSPVV